MNQSKKLRGAIIGYGFISSNGHMPAYQERMRKNKDVEIVAVCDICSVRLESVPFEVKTYTDYRELISNEKLNLDFIDVSTHAADHYSIAKMGLENGLHVLCEKPLVTNMVEANDLIHTAFNQKRILFPCHNYKHAPVIKAIREVIESGQIGIVNAITLNTFRNTHALGTKEWNPHWRRFKDLSGGGIGMDHGSHSLYLAFEWMRGYPKSVSANSMNFSYPKFDTEDNFSAVYEFDTGVANIHLSWSAGVRKVIYTIQGDKGAITVDDDHLQVSVLNFCDKETISHQATWENSIHSISSDWMDSSHVSWFNSMFDNFILAIEKNDIANKDIIDAYFCIQSISKAYESIEKKSLRIELENSFL